jgi:enoyl-[acyl-carrier-protein] reductase (NADH)
MVSTLLGLLASVGGKSVEQMTKQHASGRVLRSEDVAKMALFLASDESSALTDAAVVADGGLNCGLHLTGLRAYGGPA